MSDAERKSEDRHCPAQNARHAPAYAAEKAGIEKRVYPHGLRRSFALGGRTAHACA